MLDSSITLYLLLFLSLFFLSAFFSSAETAFFSSQKLHIRHLAKTKGVSGAKRVARIMEQPERFLAAVLLGNTFVNTAAASLGTAITVSLIEGGKAVVVATVGVTALLLVFGEIGPKTLAARHGERMALMYGHPVQILMKIFYPMIAAFLWIGDRMARLIAGKPMPQALVSEEEIRTAISAGVEEGTVEKSKAKMLEKVFHFGDRQVRAVMTPRTEIVWVEKDTSVEQFLQLYSLEPHTRFPVFEGEEENVIGIVSVKDVLQAIALGVLKPSNSVTRSLRPAHIVPETKLIGQLFLELRRTGSRMAIVVDEYGSVAGLVTLKQLLEIIFGPVRAEGAPVEEEFVAIDGNTYSVDASMGIAEANERLDLDLPEGDYQTVAGFVLEHMQRIPRVGEHFHYRGLLLEVKEVKGVKVKRVEVRRVGRPAGPPPGIVPPAMLLL